MLKLKKLLNAKKNKENMNAKLWGLQSPSLGRSHFLKNEHQTVEEWAQCIHQSPY